MYASYVHATGVFSECVCCIIFQLHTCVKSYTRVALTRVFMSAVCVSHARTSCHSRGPFKLWVICTVVQYWLGSHSVINLIREGAKAVVYGLQRIL